MNARPCPKVCLSDINGGEFTVCERPITHLGRTRCRAVFHPDASKEVASAIVMSSDFDAPGDPRPCRWGKAVVGR